MKKYCNLEFSHNTSKLNKYVDLRLSSSFTSVLEIANQPLTGGSVYGEGTRNHHFMALLVYQLIEVGGGGGGAECCGGTVGLLLSGLVESKS